MSISTKKGDNKTSTNFIKGKKIFLSKDDPYFNHVGKIDYLMSQIQLAKFEINDNEIIKILSEIQYKVFPDWYASLELANDYQKKFSNYKYLLTIENYIVSGEKELNLSKTFYELGQMKQTALIDACRSLVRDVERSFIYLINMKKLDTNYYSLNMKYINRLSDFLFIAARIIEKRNKKLRERN